MTIHDTLMTKFWNIGHWLLDKSDTNTQTVLIEFPVGDSDFTRELFDNLTLTSIRVGYGGELNVKVGLFKNITVL